MTERKRPRSWKESIEHERQLQASGTLTGTQLAESRRFLAELESAPQEEIEAYDYFLGNLPADESDHLSLVLRVQLLVEQRVREFVDERMLNSKALEAARLSAHQAICLAEALTLPNEEPQWMWLMVRRLNSIRNELAHRLQPENAASKMADFAQEYSARYALHADFLHCTAHMYSQLTELSRLARSTQFRVQGKQTSERSSPDA